MPRTMGHAVNRPFGKAEHMLMPEMVTFDSVVRTGGFTAAARELGVSKSTVSEQLARLEKALGVRLLHRTTRTLRLTEAGRAYHGYCRRIVADAREAAAAVGRMGTEVSGTLRITAPTLYGELLLPPILSEFLRSHPRVRAEILLTERMVDLIDEEFDLAVRIGSLPESTLQARRIGQARSIFVASPAYLHEHGTPKNSAALENHSLIVVGSGRDERWPVSGGRGVRALSVKGRVLINSLEAGLQLAREGLGIAWLPSFLCSHALEAGALVEILPRQAPPPYPIWAVHPSRHHLPARVRLFLDHLAAASRRRSLLDQRTRVNT